MSKRHKENKMQPELDQQVETDKMHRFVMITNLPNIKSMIFALSQEDAECTAYEIYRVLSIPYNITGYTVAPAGMIS